MKSLLLILTLLLPMAVQAETQQPEANITCQVYNQDLAILVGLHYEGFTDIKKLQDALENSPLNVTGKILYRQMLKDVFSATRPTTDEEAIILFKSLAVECATQ